MTKKEKIDFSHLTNEEKEIIHLLKSKGKCLYGNIFKELKLSQSKGT